MTGVVTSDHSAGIRSGSISVMASAGFETCWPHLAGKFGRGDILKKSHPRWESAQEQCQVCVPAPYPPSHVGKQSHIHIRTTCISYMYRMYYCLDTNMWDVVDTIVRGVCILYVSYIWG